MTQQQNVPSHGAGPLVQMRGIVKKFGLTTVLDGIDLDVHEGEVVCLIGPSGAGKSTLLRCINGLERISDGTGRIRVSAGQAHYASQPPAPPAPHNLILCIEDNGKGIAPEFHELIFDKFYQAKHQTMRKPEGSGLGLAISRDLARGMGGDLRARSVDGEGSTFTVTLRRVADADGPAGDRRTHEERRADEARRSGSDRRDSHDPPGPTPAHDATAV